VGGTLHCHPCGTGGHTIPRYMGQSMLLGGPCSTSAHAGSPCWHRWSVGCILLTSWAQIGEKPWVRAFLPVPGPKGVIVHRQLLLGSSALPGENNTMIGCDKGLSPCIAHGNSNVAQRSVILRHPFHCWILPSRVEHSAHSCPNPRFLAV